MKGVTVSDQNLIRREIYNPNRFPIEFRRDDSKAMYILGCGITLGPKVVTVSPGGRCVLNHMYYVPVTPLEEGEPFNVVSIFGNDIGKGLTAPSRPGRQW